MWFYYEVNVRSVGNEVTINMDSDYPLSEANSSPAYSLRVP